MMDWQLDALVYANISLILQYLGIPKTPLSELMNVTVNLFIVLAWHEPHSWDVYKHVQYSTTSLTLQLANFFEITFPRMYRHLTCLLKQSSVTNRPMMSSLPAASWSHTEISTWLVWSSYMWRLNCSNHTGFRVLGLYCKHDNSN